MFLLDTNVISELRRSKPHGGVVAWISAIADEQLFLSAVTIGELQAGIEITRPRDTAKADEMEAWLDRIAGSYQVLPMDAPAFREWARLMAGQPDHLVQNAMIAATARIHKLKVVTRNTRDFRGFGVPVVNPFESGK
jgi:predicted nucleic acid-binding protein